MASGDYSNAIQIIEQLLQIHPDSESKRQFAELCIRIDKGDAIVIDNIADKLIKESMQVLFSVIQMKSYSSFKKLAKKTDVSNEILTSEADSRDSYYMRSKSTPEMQTLFRNVIPENAFNDARTKLSSKRKRNSVELEQSSRNIQVVDEDRAKNTLEMNRDDWLKERTQVPIGKDGMESALKHIQQNPFEFSEGGKLSSTPRSKKDSLNIEKPDYHRSNLDNGEHDFGPALIGPTQPHQIGGLKTFSQPALTSRKSEWDRVRNKELNLEQTASTQPPREREEWMTALPSLGMRSTLDALTNRKFSTKITEPVREEDRKGWTAKPQ